MKSFEKRRGTAMKQAFISFVMMLSIAVSAVSQDGQRELKPGFNLFSKEQDIQIGKEAAAQVEQEMPIIHNRRLEDYVRKLASQLWSLPEADDYPYSIQIVQDPTINAFALPGGPMFIHTGLIEAADNEAQLAGVIAHETSHVALRHGTNQASKATPFQLLGLFAGGLVGDSLWGQLTQIGIGIGANSVLLKYSRNAERDADLLGTRLMAKAGFDPVQMATFFQKLEAEGGARGPEFFSSHPNPGNRIKAVEKEISFLPPIKVKPESQEFSRIKGIISKLPPLPEESDSKSTAANTFPKGDLLPSANFKTLKGNLYQLSHPDNWEVFENADTGSATIAPRAGIGRGADGHTLIALGLLIDYVKPRSGQVDLHRDTDALIQQIVNSNKDMRIKRSQEARWNGQQVVVTRLEAPSPLEGQVEIDTVITVARPQGLFYLVMITPQNLEADLQSTFQSILRSMTWR
jgi:Zn-dependent protease with chaperone function